LSSSVPTFPGASGLYGLRVLHEPREQQNIVNLVFVHGLGGSALGTWTHPQSKTCLLNLLYEDERFANLRIATFGYNADFKDVLMPSNALGITDFARQLLDGLDIFYNMVMYDRSTQGLINS
jgi:hypothetical protein